MFNNKFTTKDPVAEEILKVLESWDDDEDDDVKRADAELRRMKAKPIEADKKTDADKEIGKLAKKTPKEVDESVEQVNEISRDLASRYIRKTKPEFSSPEENKKREAGRSLALKKVWGDKKYGLPEPKVKATEEVEIQEKTLTPAESKKKEEIVKSMKKDKAGFKERYGKKARSVMYATATKTAKKVAEETEQLDELSVEKMRSYRNKAFDQLKKNHSKKEKIDTSKNANKFWNRYDGVNTADEKIKKKTGSYFPSPAKRIAARLRGEEVEITNEAAGPTATYDTDTNFVTSANPTSNPVTPLQRVKGLAVSAKQRLNDSMMGKAGATSEEIDPSVKTTDTLRGRKAGGKSDDVGPGSDFKSTKVKYTPGPK